MPINAALAFSEEKSTMQTLVISILSGLVGATIAAIFNYKIRLKMQEKARLEQEQNFAYVHVALLSQYAAIDL